MLSILGGSLVEETGIKNILKETELFDPLLHLKYRAYIQLGYEAW